MAKLKKRDQRSSIKGTVGRGGGKEGASVSFEGGWKRLKTKEFSRLKPYPQYMNREGGRLLLKPKGEWSYLLKKWGAKSGVKTGE